MTSLRLDVSPEVTGSIPLLRHRKATKTKSVRFRSSVGFASARTVAASTAVPRIDLGPSAFDMVRLLQQSRKEDREGTQKTFKGHVGEKAKLDFFGSFHRISQLLEANTYYSEDPSPNVAFIAETEKKRLFPQPLGIVRRKGKESEVDLHLYSMGDGYASALSEGLKKVKSVERLNLKSNRLSQQGSQRILETVRPNAIKEINLAENHMGSTPVKLLISLLEDRRNQITKLNLEHTGLANEIVKEMLGVVAFNKHLKYLNLAKNGLTEKIGEALNEMLVSNSTLKRLDLHWNALGSRGGFQLFDGMKHNRYLQMLDVSWNALGKDIATATCVAEALDKHQYLVHLDMSYNSFTFEECQVIDGGLKTNHSLLGLHMDGNECYVDSKGFIVPMHFPRLEAGHVSHRIIASSSKTKRPKPKAGNCWVCGEWVEVSFEWKAGQSGEEEDEPVYIHLECDEYHHDLLEKVGQGQFQLTRAVPPGDLKFFFSHKDTAMLSSSIPSIRIVEPVTVSYQKWPDFSPVLTVTRVNHLHPIGEICLIKEPFATKPRTPPLMYVPPGIGMEKVPWTIPISLFKDYVFDTNVSGRQDMLMNCFEFDWKTSRIATLVKEENQLAAVKESLRAAYPRL